MARTLRPLLFAPAELSMFQKKFGQLAVVAPKLAAVALAALAVTSGCTQAETAITLPQNYNTLRNRSVKIDAAQCLTLNGTATAPVACADMTIAANGLKAVGLRGGNGTDKTALSLDDGSKYHKNFGNLSWFWHRIPVGYGCAVSMQGLFPDPSKDPTDANQFKFDALSVLIKAAHDAGGSILWTAGYDIGDGTGKCNYLNGEQKGNGIADPAKWAKAVRTVLKYYDRTLAESSKAICDAVPTGQAKPYNCATNIFNVEFMRDPFGAGGFVDAPDGRAKWLAAYKQFATQIRDEFKEPGNDVAIVGPSVVIRGALQVANTAGANRSPIFDFIDYVVATKNDDPTFGCKPLTKCPANAANGCFPGEDLPCPTQLPLTYLSFEIEADSPQEVYDIVKTVADYAWAHGLRHEKYFAPLYGNGKLTLTNKDGSVVGHVSDGSEPIPIFITDLRMGTPPLPAALKADPVRLSNYKDAFYAASKILLQGLVMQMSSTNGPRFATVDASSVTAEAAAQTAKVSDDFWFNNSKLGEDGTLSPASWHSFWFAPGYVENQQLIAVVNGPDASGSGNGTPVVDSTKAGGGLVLMATKETCVDKQQSPIECIPLAVGQTVNDKPGQRRIRTIISDYNVNLDSDQVEHDLRVDVDHIAKDVKSVYYRWAYFDPTWTFWPEPKFQDEGKLDADQGSFHITKPVAVPSVQYFEFVY